MDKFPGFEKPHYTQVPDEFFDVLMPQLSDPELRVLLYIIRRTLGFKKEADNIGIGQMVSGITTREGEVLDRGAGISRASAFRAVKGLLEKGIIETRKNVSSSKGSEPSTYSLKWRTGEPPGVFVRPPYAQSETPLVSGVDPQETVSKRSKQKSRKDREDMDPLERYTSGKFGHLVQH